MIAKNGHFSLAFEKVTKTLVDLDACRLDPVLVCLSRYEKKTNHIVTDFKSTKNP